MDSQLISFSQFHNVEKHKCLNSDDVFISYRQQRQQVKQTLLLEQHKQILKELERHRPTKSVNGRQPVAEGTDVLYDIVSATKHSKK